MFHSSFLTAKSVNLVVACDSLPLRNGKFSIFFILATLITQLFFKYFSICMGRTQLATKCNSYFAFQTIIDVLEHTMP